MYFEDKSLCCYVVKLYLSLFSHPRHCFSPEKGQLYFCLQKWCNSEFYGSFAAKVAFLVL